MKTDRIIGKGLIALGIAMLFFGASLFSYSGKPLDPIISTIGKYSFLLWIPTIVLGITILNIKWKKKS